MTLLTFRISGEILIDGVDIKTFKHEALHRLITIVQEGFAVEYLQRIYFAKLVKSKSLCYSQEPYEKIFCMGQLT